MSDKQADAAKPYDDDSDEEASGEKGESSSPTKVQDLTTAGRDIPPENGRRAWFDSKTGEVHGSGSGAGGGNGGEDFDDGTPGGS